MPAGVYDAAATKRFYITVLNYELDEGMHLEFSQLLIAASVSSNPADGFLGPYTGVILAYTSARRSATISSEKEYQVPGTTTRAGFPERNSLQQTVLPCGLQAEIRHLRFLCWRDGNLPCACCCTLVV